jgi:hypothetical protein
MDYPNARDCEHGRQRGKCADCDLKEAQAELIALRAVDSATEYPDFAWYTKSMKDDSPAGPIHACSVDAVITACGLSLSPRWFFDHKPPVGRSVDCPKCVRVGHCEPATENEAELTALRAMAEAYLSEWNLPGPQCTCDEAYKGRHLEDPACLYHQSPATWDALAALAEWERVRGGGTS